MPSFVLKDEKPRNPRNTSALRIIHRSVAGVAAAALIITALIVSGAPRKKPPMPKPADPAKTPAADKQPAATAEEAGQDAVKALGEPPAP